MILNLVGRAFNLDHLILKGYLFFFLLMEGYDFSSNIRIYVLVYIYSLTDSKLHSKQIINITKTTITIDVEVLVPRI